MVQRTIFEAEVIEEEEKRRFPWLIDVLLYPTSLPGLTNLAIFLLLPPLVNLIAPFIIHGHLIASLINGVTYAYMLSYLAECVSDSGKGGLRAPENIASQADLHDTMEQAARIVLCGLLFLMPPIIYVMWTERTDTVFWAMLIVCYWFFPAAMLAVATFADLTGLNPLLLVRSIIIMLPRYAPLAAVFVGYSIIMTIILQAQSGILIGSISILAYYLLFVWAHLLGRLYYRYSDALGWE